MLFWKRWFSALTRFVWCTHASFHDMLCCVRGCVLKTHSLAWADSQRIVSPSANFWWLNVCLDLSSHYFSLLFKTHIVVLGFLLTPISILFTFPLDSLNNLRFFFSSSCFCCIFALVASRSHHTSLVYPSSRFSFLSIYQSPSIPHFCYVCRYCLYFGHKGKWF